MDTESWCWQWEVSENRPGMASKYFVHWYLAGAYFTKKNCNQNLKLMEI